VSHHVKPAAAESSSPSTTSSAAPSGAATPSSAPSTSAPPPSFAGTTWTPGYIGPAGVGSPAGIRIAVNRVRLVGTYHQDRVYQLTLTLKNITSSMVLFTLNDFNVVAPSQPDRYSQNDAMSQGLSQNASLFPYPLSPKVPSATTLQIPSGATKTGEVTVLVPPAARYDVYVAGLRTPVASFTAPSS
jgi:hypothetical protein